MAFAVVGAVAILLLVGLVICAARWLRWESLKFEIKLGLAHFHLEAQSPPKPDSDPET